VSFRRLQVNGYQLQLHFTPKFTSQRGSSH